MFGRLAFALSLAACGRVGFDGPDLTTDAPADGSLDVPADASCTLGDWGPATLETSLNRGANDDYGAQLSPDGLAIVFDSSNVSSLDLFWSERASRTAAWSTPRALTELNDATSIDNDGTLTADLLEMYFASQRGGPFCLFRSTRTDRAQPWSAPQRQSALCLGVEIGGPWISPDGLRLYYNTREDVAGEGRVYMTERSSRTQDFAAGTRVDIAGQVENHGYVALADDERTIYFESGSPLQISRATRAAIGDAFGPPTLVPQTNEATSNNGDPSLTADGKLLMWASTRNAGQFDLYSITRSCL